MTIIGEKTAKTLYKKSEDFFVGGYNSVSDKFLERFFQREGESLEETKARLAKK